MKGNNREKTLVKNTLIISIGTICTKLITFLLLPLYTGILTTEEYGIVDLLNTLVSLLLPIVTFQVEQAAFREIIEVREEEAKKKKIISCSIISVIIQCLFFWTIFLLISPLIHNEYKIYLALNVTVYTFSSLFLQIARGLGDNKRYSMGSFISAFFTIMFNIIFLLAIKLRVEGMLIGTMIGQIVCVVYLFVFLKLYKYINIKEYSWKTVKRLWKYSLPLIPNAISWWIFGSSDRVIVTILLGVSMNGILSAASKFSAMYIILYNIFNMSWTESVALHINDEDIEDYFSRMFNIILSVFSSIAIIMIAMMPFIYPIMINSNFSAGYVIVPILIIGSLFNVIVGIISVIYVAKKNTKAIASTSIISALLNIIIHLALINSVGLYAAAISTFASFFIMSIYRWYDVRKKYFKINLNKTKIYISIIVLIIVSVTYYLDIIYLQIISAIIVFLYAFIINKKSIKAILSLIERRI